MDANRLDTIATLLASGAPRRRLLSACAVALGGAVLPGVALACKKVGKKCDKSKDCCDGATCKSGKCKCKGGLTECDGACVDLDSDNQHCGACNNSCTGRATCKNGTLHRPRLRLRLPMGRSWHGERRVPAPGGTGALPLRLALRRRSRQRPRPGLRHRWRLPRLVWQQRQPERPVHASPARRHCAG